MKKKSLCILNGRIIDPANQVDEVTAIYIDKGKIVSIGERPADFKGECMDATGLIVSPGLIDLCAHLREPGFEYKGTIRSETAAAAAGGITSLCCPPDTNPVIDTPAVALQIRSKAKKAGNCRVFPVGAQTQGLRGEQLSEMNALKNAGCIAVSNGGKPLHNSLVLRRTLEYAGTFDLLTMSRPEDHHLANSGCVHEGKVADRLGLPGIPAAAESLALSAQLELAAHTGTSIHFQTLSSGRGAQLLAQSRHDIKQATADVAIHQLFLTDLDITEFDAHAHVRPPLRSESDQTALRQALKDNVISAICSDHQPHESDAKMAPFAETEPGISGLETLLPLTMKLVEAGVLDLSTAIARLTTGPADILGLPTGRLNPGSPADLCIFSMDEPWTFDRNNMLSTGKNTPFDGWDFNARVHYTILAGRVVYAKGIDQ